MKNVIQDLKVKTADYSCYKCKVHLGFYSNYLAFKPDLMEKIKVLKLAYPSALVFMTGHSLGAALAVFAAIDVGETYDSPTIVYNFGQPRIGNS